MIFHKALDNAGFLFDETTFDGCYVKTDSEGFIHCYQRGEEEGEWNYVKMTEDFDVIHEVTFNPDDYNNTVVQ
jgi:hypothetical protein